MLKMKQSKHKNLFQCLLVVACLCDTYRLSSATTSTHSSISVSDVIQTASASSDHDISSHKGHHHDHMHHGYDMSTFSSGGNNREDDITNNHQHGPIMITANDDPMPLQDQPASSEDMMDKNTKVSSQKIMDHTTHSSHSGMNMDKMKPGAVGMDMHGMMVFHTGVDETVLFKIWHITTIGGLLASMVGIALLAMFYEGLKYFREHLFKKYLSSMQFSTVAVTGESGRVTQLRKEDNHRILSWAHAIQTTLHVVQIIISYFLMLIFMTYNVWLCLAVIFGAGAGYFIFGWKKATVVDITEHCH